MRNLASGRVVAPVAVLAVLAAGCTDAGPCTPGGVEAVRVEEFRDSWFGNTWMAEARITDISIDGQPVEDLGRLVQYPAGNVVIERGGLTCTMPCAFGAAPGRYAFDVHVFGYLEERVHAQPEAAGTEACPAVAAPVVVVPELEPGGTILEEVIVIPNDPGP